MFDVARLVFRPPQPTVVADFSAALCGGWANSTQTSAATAYGVYPSSSCGIYYRSANANVLTGRPCYGTAKTTAIKVKLMTQQEIFNTVKKHLLSQNERSVEGTACRYRGPRGLKCAAGILIPDSEYTESMEGKGWPCGKTTTSPLRNIADKLGHNNLIRNLQIVHDSYDPTHWPAQLKNVSTNYELEY